LSSSIQSDDEDAAGEASESTLPSSCKKIRKLKLVGHEFFQSCAIFRSFLSKNFCEGITTMTMALGVALLTTTLIVAAHAQVHPDVMVVLNVTGGVTPGGVSWADSYSIGNECYCRSTFDHNIGPFYVETPLGWLRMRQVCDLLGPGPGNENRPVYNDLQCGNGPPNDAGDEHVCPGRTDLGEEGCGQIGPKWNFENLTNVTVAPLTVPADAHPDIVAVLNVTGGLTPNASMADSYSDGVNCYCASSFDHGIGDFYVDTPVGWLTVREICDLLGPGPGISGRVVYNDVQCGNGPPNDAGDEHACPGRVDIGDEGCGHIGPRWNFDSVVIMSSSPSMALSLTSEMPTSETIPSAPPTSEPTSGHNRQSITFGVSLVSIVMMVIF